MSSSSLTSDLGSTTWKDNHQLRRTNITENLHHDSLKKLVGGSLGANRKSYFSTQAKFKDKFPARQTRLGDLKTNPFFLSCETEEQLKPQVRNCERKSKIAPRPNAPPSTVCVQSPLATPNFPQSSSCPFYGTLSIYAIPSTLTS